jgi:DNA-binding NarL/FixJ family response regulator
VHARPVSCPVLIGRDRELDALHAARNGLARSRAAFVLIGGEAGIGKSRLLAQFVRGAGDRRARTIAQAECLEHAPQPFGPIRDAIAILARGTDAPLPPVLASLISRETTAELVEKADLFAAVAAYLKDRARERATILTIEDLHWADATTLEFLGYLSARIGGTRLLIVGTYRSDESESHEALSAALARAMRDPTTVRIDLRSLKRAELRALLHGALEGHVTLEPAILDDIVARTDGNPFFGEELLKNALEHSGDVGRASLPISIRTSILERLRAFSSDERRTIDQAAVLGLRFDPHILAQTMSVPLEVVLPALRRARDANIIVEEDGERVRFRFRHALTRQAVYDSLLLFDARRTHRAILETLESMGAENEYLEELAYHAWEARDTRKARRYNELAGERAFALFALPEARACFERAREMAADSEEETPLLERLSRVTSMLGEVEKAIELFEATIAGYIELENFARACVVVGWSAADRNNSGDTKSVAFGRAFLDRYWARIPIAPRDELVAMLARIAIISYDVATAELLLSRIEAPATLTIPARQNLLLTRSEIAEVSGDSVGWAGSAAELVDLLPEIRVFPQLSSGYTVALAASYFVRDDLVDRIFALIDRTESRGAEFGVLRSYGKAVRSVDHFARGRLDRAADALRQTSEDRELFVSDTVLAGVAPFVADALDDDSLVPARLHALFAETRRQARHGDDVTVLAGSACVLLRRRNVREAVSDLRLGLRCLSRPQASSRALLVLAAQHLPVSELPSLSRFIDIEVHADDKAGHTNARALAAIVAHRTGDEARAIELATSVAESYRSLGRPLREAAALEIARRIDDARAIYLRHGAVGYAKRLGSRSASFSAHAELSERERQVADFVAAGLGNSEIAERLSISKKTVEKYVGSIYDKLGVRSRAQLAGLLARGQATTG